MTRLILTPNMDAPDDIYADLVAAHDGLTEAESAALNARLILILANHIGSRSVLQEALRHATDPAGTASDELAT